MALLQCRVRIPAAPHHRGASLLSIISNPRKITCNKGSNYFRRPEPNLNVINSAMVDGPDVITAMILKGMLMFLSML
jgi:hypothetical protein